MDERFARQVALFGEAGQARIRSTRVAIVGVGGTGSHIVQQLVLLGVRDFALVEPEEIDHTNRNRYVGVRHDDPIPGTLKLHVAERLIRSIEPTASVELIPTRLVTERAFEAIRNSNVVFGCLDKDGPRLILNELCAAYERRYIDVASEVIPGDPPVWGGRVCICWDRPGCLVCYDEIDPGEAAQELSGPEGEDQRRAIYGVEAEALGGSGPSVVSVNGGVASLAVTEFMAGITGLRSPIGLMTCRGRSGKVLVPGPDSGLPRPNCYYCRSIRGMRESADVERYIREGVGEYL